MNRSWLLGVFTALLLAFTPTHAAGVDPPPTAEMWVEQYGKLGGKAFLWPREEATIGIQKRAGQKPLISLKGLKPAGGIRRVVLQGFEVDDGDLEALADWKELEQIDVIDGLKKTDKGVKLLAALPKLSELVLADTAVTASGLSAFSGHKELARLSVESIENQVKRLDLEGLPKLQNITLSCAGVKTLRLAKLPKLEWITYFPVELEEAEVSELGSLTELDFRGCRLKKLSLSGVPKLESLDLRKTQLDVDAVAELKKSFPSVKVRR